ncbi:response regulator [Allosphingosinicella indica]|uniref:response regulator n=1 Tax=Allosphingosinicella indica TaxID=941907 RepID=UPI001FCDBC65|nr:response regulator [Allosphingosinicella indica]
MVEDEALLAMDIEAMLEDAGHRVVAEAASLYDVEQLGRDLKLDLALVDIQLAEGTSGLDVCRLIRERWSDAFIVFVTANPKKIPDDFCEAHGVIPKPFSRSGLMAAMNYIVEGVCDPPPTSPQPASFIAAPAFAASW